jgi:hypothetical protein
MKGWQVMDNELAISFCFDDAERQKPMPEPKIAFVAIYPYREMSLISNPQMNCPRE